MRIAPVIMLLLKFLIKNKNYYDISKNPEEFQVVRLWYL